MDEYETMIRECLTDVTKSDYKPKENINDWAETLINSGTKGVLTSYHHVTSQKIG